MVHEKPNGRLAMKPFNIIWFWVWLLPGILHGQKADTVLMAQSYQQLSRSGGMLLKDALLILEELYDVHFIYEDELLKNRKSAPVDKITGNFHKDLRKVLGVHPIHYLKVGRKTYVLYSSKNIASRGRMIRGRVQDTHGRGIPGAEVFIQGTPWGAAADENGDYAIPSVPEGKYTLIARCMGYRTVYREVLVREKGILTQDFVLDVDVLNMEEIVTLASRNPLTKIESSVAITTANNEQIFERFPLSTADLLKAIPGFYIESSGGVSGNNLFPRGIPQDGSYRYVAFYEDGIPIFEAPELSFANIDIFMRIDETIAAMEGVRGGTGSIYASNAPGGIINFVSKTGGEGFQGVTRLTLGTRGLYRLDYNMGGALLQKVRFNVGGFFRYDNGIRPPGFIANRGGQVKANLTYLFRRGYLRAFVKYLNDRNIFYLPVPLQNPDRPVPLPGFNPNYGTMTSVYADNVLFPTPAGEVLEGRISDGIHPRAFSAALESVVDLGKGWTVQNVVRYFQARLQFNAIFSLDNPFPATLFADSVKQLWRLPGFNRWEYRYADTGRPIPQVDRLNGNGLVALNGWWMVSKPMQSIANRLILKKRIKGHTFSLGTYLSAYGADDFWYWHNILTEVKDAPRLLDLVAINRKGEVIARVTDKGFEQYGTFYVNARNRAFLAALSMVDEWQINDRLRLDAGIRLEFNRFRGEVENTRRDFRIPGARSWAETNVTFGTGTFREYQFTFSEWAVSVGGNYSVSQYLAFYGRASRGFRTPDFDQWLFSGQRGNSQYVHQFESGIKFSGSRLALFGTVFFSQLNHIPFIDELFLNGRIVKRSRYASSTTIGTEFEVIWQPTRRARISVIGTLQDPRLRNFNPLFIDPQTGKAMRVSLDGKQVRRIPRVILEMRPAYHIGPVKLYGFWQYIGRRFVDDANTAVLPAYHLLHAGIVYKPHRRGIQIAVSVNNVTNAMGLTEGNPRVDQVFANRRDRVFMARPVLGRTFTLSAAYSF